MIFVVAKHIFVNAVILPRITPKVVFISYSIRLPEVKYYDSTLILHSKSKA